MKKFLLIIALTVILLLGYLYRSTQLKSQFLHPTLQPSVPTTVDDCNKFSEDVANDCYQRFALEKKDASYCDQISKQSKVMECRREVEFLKS